MRDWEVRSPHVIDHNSSMNQYPSRDLCRRSAPADLLLLLLFGLAAAFSGQARASEKKLCAVDSDLSFEFEGRRSGAESLLLGKYEVFRPYKGVDSFAYAYTIRALTGAGKSKSELWFNEDMPRCSNVGKIGDLLFVLSDNAVFRFMTPGGKRGGKVLSVSFDQGKTFSPNLFPGSEGSTESPEAARQHTLALNAFGYSRSRFSVEGGVFLLELTNPLDYEKFLVFESVDRGKSWQVQPLSGDARVFPKAEVDRWRDQFATDKWFNQKYAAVATCRKDPKANCLEVERALSELWLACLKQKSARQCLATVEVPSH